jgi:hypothetical protein
MKQVRPIKMCKTVSYNKAHIGGHLSDTFLIQNKEMLYRHCLLYNILLGKPSGAEIKHLVCQ